MTRNGAEKYGRFSTDSHNSVIFLGVLVSKDQEIKKNIYFLLSVQQCLGPKFPGSLLSLTDLCVNVMGHMDSPVKILMLVNYLHLHLASRHVITKFQETFTIKEFYRKLLPFLQFFRALGSVL